ncbi:hypothetical protein E2C01_051726 [Portunus trituberculatus]|uniref:Uncharacterized protein n=1 Tax=Portunus trituberculatus TaxID=210409 RepID=A0A5B7GJL1_PORTR|nr:hypothetical protein [Portunus trituberculatus]
MWYLEDNSIITCKYGLASKISMKSFSQVNILIARMELMTSSMSRTRLSVRLAMASLNFEKPLPIRPDERNVIIINTSCKAKIPFIQRIQAETASSVGSHAHPRHY